MVIRRLACICMGLQGPGLPPFLRKIQGPLCGQPKITHIVAQILRGFINQQVPLDVEVPSSAYMKFINQQVHLVVKVVFIGGFSFLSISGGGGSSVLSILTPCVTSIEGESSAMIGKVCVAGCKGCS